MRSERAGFEVLRFEAVPAPGAVAVLELEGTFAQAPPRRVRLLVERHGGSAEVPAVTVADDPWTATFAIALDDLADPRTAYALVPDRGALVGLPAPTGAGEEDRYVRMARTANDLRRRAGERAEAAEAAERRAGEAEAERERLAGELATLRAEVEAARSRAEDAERTADACRAQRDSALASTDERVAAAERDAAGAREALEASEERERATEQRADAAERDAAAQRARAEAADREAADLREAAADEKDRADDLDERLVAAEDEVRAARRELRDTRARLEAVLRERGGRAPARHGYVIPGETDEEDEDDAVRVADERRDDPTAPLPEVRAEDTGDEPADDDADDDTAGADTPARALATRPTRTMRVEDDAAEEDEAADDDEDVDAGIDLEDEGEQDAVDAAEADATEERAASRRPSRQMVDHSGSGVMPPAAVGARYIEPSTSRHPQLTPERLIVGGALAVLVLLLLLILLGVF